MSILVIRFSALGDVALTIPVFKTLEQQQPNQHFYFLTKSTFKDLFKECKNVTVIPVNLDKDYNGIKGLKSLANHLLSYKFDKVIDLHDVLRTKVIRSLLQLNGKEVIVFKKGRKEKKAALNDSTKLSNLPHTTKRYLDAFNFLDIDGSLVQGPWLGYLNSSVSSKILERFNPKEKPQKWIGIAPFSKHKSKEWSIDKIHKLIQQINENFDAQIFLFAFGVQEQKKAVSLITDYPTICIIDESSTFNNQLILIKKLDVMISMDSANMHLASLLGTKVVSIWISTHPKIGFGPLSNENLTVLPVIKKTNWKPLSIYGKVKDKDLDKVSHARDSIKIENVFDKLKQALIE